MNEQINDLMYHAGLTAQGCWDSLDDYDHQAIMKFAELIVRECMRMCEVAEVGLLTHGLKEQSYGAVGAKQHISDWFEVDK